MLAKKFKIETLKQQREFICEQLKNKFEIAKKTNGDMSYIYEGYLYHEVEEYFKKEGFVITPVSREGGNPILYVFTIDCELKEEDLIAAEEVEYHEPSVNEEIANSLGSMVEFLNQANEIARLRFVNHSPDIDLGD